VGKKVTRGEKTPKAQRRVALYREYEREGRDSNPQEKKKKSERFRAQDAILIGMKREKEKVWTAEAERGARERTMRETRGPSTQNSPRPAREKLCQWRLGERKSERRKKKRHINKKTSKNET